jgi:MATE family multidrug resistance protein
MPSLVFQAYKQFTDGLGHTRIGMYVTGAAVVLNAVGNFILIHGISIHGTEISPAFGLNGSALASLFSRWMMAVLIILYVHRSRLFKKYTETAWHRSPPWSRYAQLLRLGIPNGLTYVFEVGAFTFSSVMMGWIGAAPLAAHQVALNLASISFLVTAGIGVAASIRVGFELGQHRVEEARFAGRTAVGLGAGFMLASAVTVFLGREWLAHVYTQDLQVIAFAASFLGIAAAFQFFDGVQAVAVGVLRGLQDTHWPSILALIAYWVVGLPLGYFLTFKTGLQGDGIWWGLFVGLTLTAIFLTVRMERAFSQLRSDRVSRS